MALYPLQAQNPLGQFDGLDSTTTTLKGGEIVGLTAVSTSGSDLKAADLADGYVGTSTPKYRPGVTRALVAGMRPLFLADEGTTGYGTLFGTLVGAAVGQTVTGGTVLGPHTASGSGKVTLWGNPGLYAVSLDAVDTAASTGLSVTNSSLTVGSALYATPQGLLTPTLGQAFESVVVARFVEFTGPGSLVTSSLSQVQALNSPVGASAAGLSVTQAVISFQGVDG